MILVKFRLNNLSLFKKINLKTKQLYLLVYMMKIYVYAKSTLLEQVFNPKVLRIHHYFLP